MDKVKCNYCDREFESYDSMRRHASRTHKINTQQCYLEYHHNGEHPKCKCGCGELVTWNKTGGRFNELIRGHYSRLPGKNNWGHNKDAIEKSAETRRQQYKSGEREIWNKGIDKNTNEAMRRCGENGSNTIMSNPTERKNRSDKMKKQWEDGNLIPLTGPNHPQWNGGSSAIQVIARNDKRLYEEWKFPILKRDNFCCVECGEAQNLHVHHDDISFADIIQIIFLENRALCESDDHEDKKEIASKVIDYHIEKNVSGTTLCYKCHNELHPSLNFG